MNLRAEQYEQIVKQLRSEKAAGRTAERRISPRVGLRAQVRVIPCRTSVEPSLLTVWIRDVSADGVGLLFPHAVEPGTYLVLTLPKDKSEETSLDLLFLSTRCEPLGNGQFSVGARFHRVITEDDVK